MVKGRNRNIVIKSQFNINGSRGKDVGKFIADYVSRPNATEVSSSYLVDPFVESVPGDGVSFTNFSTHISRDKTLDIAEHVQSLHRQGKRAIQQMVISFDPDYLVSMGVVDKSTPIRRKHDYAGNYDDVRLRHAVRKGLLALIENEGYRDGKLIAAIQHDTLHLHVHAVVYENHPKIARKRGSEEKGVIKPTSFNILSNEIDRHLKLTKPTKSITRRSLTPKRLKPKSDKKVQDNTPVLTSHVDRFLDYLIYSKSHNALLDQVNNILDSINLEVFDEDYIKKELS